MTNPRAFRSQAGAAFTLIELLVVIAIIAVLAALIFPASAMIKRRAMIRKAQTELRQVSTAIDVFKEKIGVYPPDNPLMVAGQFNYATNQLYYELVGTKLENIQNVPTYQTLDGHEQIPAASVSAAFGGNVAGFVNCNKGGGDEAAVARPFLKGLKPGQYDLVTNSGVSLRLLTCSVTWPRGTPYESINPWRYNSSNPTNNPNSYELWVDVLIAGKTNRISNWSKQPQRVGS